MKASELRGKTDLDLQDELHALLREQFNLRVQTAVGQFKRVHQFQEVRRNIARVKTVLRERQQSNE
jgi:large subunit ribosomal protein L29